MIFVSGFGAAFCKVKGNICKTTGRNCLGCFFLHVSLSFPLQLCLASSVADLAIFFSVTVSFLEYGKSLAHGGVPDR